MFVDAEVLRRQVPNWVPNSVFNYLTHVQTGEPIRVIARAKGCHASTILRQIQNTEARRDDLLIDLALRRLTAAIGRQTGTSNIEGKWTSMTKHDKPASKALPDEDELKREAPRMLRRLNEQGASLAIARDMEKAVIVKDAGDGQTLKTAVLDLSLIHI